MDVLKNKNASKVKIDTPKVAAKRARKQALADKESEIDNVIADKSLSKEERNAQIAALEAEIKAL